MAVWVFSTDSVLSWGQKYSQTGFWTGSLRKQRGKNILNSSVLEWMLPQWIFLLRLTFCCLKTVCLTTVYFHTRSKTQQRNVCSFFVSYFCSTSPYWLMVGCCCQDLRLEKTPITRFPISSYSRLWVFFFFGILLRFLEELLSCSTCSAGSGVVTPLSCCGCVFCASVLVDTSQLLL